MRIGWMEEKMHGRMDGGVKRRRRGHEKPEYETFRKQKLGDDNGLGAKAIVDKPTDRQVNTLRLAKLCVQDGWRKIRMAGCMDVRHLNSRRFEWRDGETERKMT